MDGPVWAAEGQGLLQELTEAAVTFVLPSWEPLFIEK